MFHLKMHIFFTFSPLWHETSCDIIIGKESDTILQDIVVILRLTVNSVCHGKVEVERV